MKEITRVITLEFTLIEKVEEYDMWPKDGYKERIEKVFVEEGVDHALVTNIQDFIRDIEEDVDDKF